MPAKRCAFDQSSSRAYDHEPDSRKLLPHEDHRNAGRAEQDCRPQRSELVLIANAGTGDVARPVAVALTRQRKRARIPAVESPGCAHFNGKGSPHAKRHVTANGLAPMPVCVEGAMARDLKSSSYLTQDADRTFRPRKKRPAAYPETGRGA